MAKNTFAEVMKDLKFDPATGNWSKDTTAVSPDQIPKRPTEPIGLSAPGEPEDINIQETESQPEDLPSMGISNPNAPISTFGVSDTTADASPGQIPSAGISDTTSSPDDFFGSGEGLIRGLLKLPPHVRDELIFDISAKFDSIGVDMPYHAVVDSITERAKKFSTLDPDSIKAFTKRMNPEQDKSFMAEAFANFASVVKGGVNVGTALHDFARDVGLESYKPYIQAADLDQKVSDLPTLKDFADRKYKEGMTGLGLEEAPIWKIPTPDWSVTDIKLLDNALTDLFIAKEKESGDILVGESVGQILTEIGTGVRTGLTKGLAKVPGGVKSFKNYIFDKLQDRQLRPRKPESPLRKISDSPDVSRQKLRKPGPEPGQEPLTKSVKERLSENKDLKPEDFFQRITGETKAQTGKRYKEWLKRKKQKRIAEEAAEASEAPGLGRVGTTEGVTMELSPKKVKKAKKAKNGRRKKAKQEKLEKEAEQRKKAEQERLEKEAEQKRKAPYQWPFSNGKKAKNGRRKKVEQKEEVGATEVGAAQKKESVKELTKRVNQWRAWTVGGKVEGKDLPQNVIDDIVDAAKELLDDKRTGAGSEALHVLLKGAPRILRRLSGLTPGPMQRILKRVADKDRRRRAFSNGSKKKG